MGSFVLAADLGGTNLRTAIVADDGRIVHRIKRPTPGDAHAIAKAISDSSQECISAVKGSERPKALCIAVAATINPSEGILRNAPNLPFLNGFDLAAAVEAEIDIPTVADNDATLAAIGENWRGASRGYANTICVTLGTGVGGGLILNGEPYRGVDGTAGEIGHICVEPEGVECGCGSRGCLEQYASATAIVRIARELLTAFPGSELNGKESFDSRELFESSMRSDPLAVEAFQITSRYLGIAMAGLVNVLNPEMIVIGGGMAGAWEIMNDPVNREIRQRAFRTPAERVRLVAAKLGDDAGIFGAARVALLSRTQTSTTIV